MLDDKETSQIISMKPYSRFQGALYFDPGEGGWGKRGGAMKKFVNLGQTNKFLLFHPRTHHIFLIAKTYILQKVVQFHIFVQPKHHFILTLG